MANPLNLRFPMVQGSDGAFATNSNTLNAIADDLKILLLTNHGERPCQFNFGANLRSLVFEAEGDSLAQQIKDHIHAAIATWMPFVTVKNIVILTQANSLSVPENTIRLKISFTVGAIPQVATLVQDIRR